MLRLLAHTAQDLTVISALVQDAAVRRDDIHYDSKARRFVLLLQRYRWEADKTRTRIRSALRLEHVTRVQSRGINGGDEIFSLLAVRAEKTGAQMDEPLARLTLDFSGSAALQLDLETLECVLEDVTDSWQAGRRPAHEL